MWGLDTTMKIQAHSQGAAAAACAAGGSSGDGNVRGGRAGLISPARSTYLRSFSHQVSISADLKRRFSPPAGCACEKSTCK